MWLIGTKAFGITNICRLAHQDWLTKMLWGCHFICSLHYDTLETFEPLKFCRFRRHHASVSMSSYFNTIAIRLHCEVSRSRAAFLRQSGNFLFPSYCLRRRKMADDTDGCTNERQRWYDLTGCPYDGLTKGKMYTRIKHENEPSQSLSPIFGMPQILPPLMKFLPKPEKSYRRLYDGFTVLTNGPIFSRSELNLTISFIMFPSGVKFGQCDACFKVYIRLGK